ncbi:toll/interleukin-1 receptor domain-containing protein [Tessaracoccus defluvii]|uniref:TIR domain-containing protein n=1 Tax=Tessaracoccus defluvii TaxID=1285901 RepID=A0A7H0H2N0_9ACTN|nr:toll/interleukin-1 receptor domain-containing protein [Tessaracoccus defluvii]QNP54796.1 TIR domain-containing protein [Tessaracoccus defluvii]
MISVFVSYSRLDANRVLPLVEKLKASGFIVWIDQTSIAASVPWHEEIIKAIRSADLVIVMDSTHFRESQACAAEVSVADRLRKSSLVIDLADTRTNWVELVTLEADQIGPIERVRSLLLGASYRWDRAGRPRDHLVRGPLLSNFATVLPLTDDPYAAEFVRASRKRRRRRRYAAAFAGLTTVSIILASRVVAELDDAVHSRIESATVDMATAHEVEAALRRSPAAGLRLAVAEAEAADTWSTRMGLAGALQQDLPLSVTRPGEGASPGTAPTLPSGFEATQGSQRIVVTPAGLRIEGPVPLRLSLGPVTAVAWSQDGRLIAAATAQGVRVIRVDSGIELAVLRGFEGAITDLAWSDEGLTAVAGTSTATWAQPAVTPSATTDFEVHAASMGPTGSALLVGAAGELALWDGQALAHLAGSIPFTDFLSVRSTGSGWVVASNTEDGGGLLTPVSSSGEIGPETRLGGCEPFAMAVADSTAIIGCFASDVLQVRLADGHSERLPVNDFQVAGLIRDTDGTLLATSVYGEFFRWTGEEWAMLGAWSTGCTFGSTILEPSPDGRRILVSGSGVSSLCTHLRNHPDDRSDQNRLVPPSGVQTIRAASWSPDGRTLAAAAASGELWLFDAEHYVTREVMVPSGLELVGVEFIDSSSVLIATRDGEILTVDVSMATADLAGQRALAEEMLIIAEQLEDA